MIRGPAVAGQFYPARAARLKADVTDLLDRSQPPREALAVVVPHAGYVYSGPVAGAVYGRVSIPETVALLGPNHTGRGVPVSVWPGGAWRTPLGDVEVDEAFVAALQAFPRLPVTSPPTCSSIPWKCSSPSFRCFGRRSGLHPSSSPSIP